jgi:hypothetical protein
MAGNTEVLRTALAMVVAGKKRFWLVDTSQSSLKGNLIVERESKESESLRIAICKIHGAFAVTLV